jgi:hypothetical protein
VRRGGPRRRWITRADADVWCPGGRWGPRRTRVTECWATLRAEDFYTALLGRPGEKVSPGSHGSVSCTLRDRPLTADWELRQNAVWRFGRLFLKCPRCARRATRLYWPLETSWLACRRCYGLSYNSRALNNYKDSLWGRGEFARAFGTTQRQWAYERTDEGRSERQKASRERWATRRESGRCCQPSKVGRGRTP